MDKFIIRKKVLHTNHTQVENTIEDDGPSSSASASTSASSPSSNSQPRSLSSPVEAGLSKEKDTEIETLPSGPGRTGRSFKSQWKKQFTWLSYNADLNKAFCKLCQNIFLEKKVPHLTKDWAASYKAFVTDGFCNWKKSQERFRSHESSDLHRHAVQAFSSLNQGENVLASISKEKLLEMKNSRICLLKIISSIKFLACQGLALRGHAEDQSNFVQLLQLRAEDIPELQSWMARTKNKWISHEIVNEILEMLGNCIRNEIQKKIQTAPFFAIIADETTDISTKEQLSICFRTVDDNLDIHEYFFGLYETPFTNSETLYTVLKDVLLRFSIDIKHCRGQCYDGAANVSGVLSGLQKRICADEPRAVYVHCLAHSLNLVVQDAMNNIPKLRDFLALAKDMINFVKSSPKRIELLKTITTNSDYNNSTGLKPFCPTRWCVRIVSLKSIYDNYQNLTTFMEELSQERSEAGAKGSGFLTKLESFEFCFLLCTSIKIFEKVEVINSSLQKVNASIDDSLSKIYNLIETMKALRDENKFHLLWQSVLEHTKSHHIDEPSVPPRQRKIPAKLGGSANQFAAKSAKEYYRIIYFEILDVTTESLRTRFKTDSINKIVKLEKFLIKKQHSPEEFQDLLSYFKEDFDANRLILHKDMFFDLAKVEEFKSASEIKIFFNKNEHLKDMLGEYFKTLKLFFTIPTTSCTAERSFSSLRRLNSYLRSTMKQERLNNVILLNVHRELAKEIDCDAIADKFIEKTSQRQNTFAMHKS